MQDQLSSDLASLKIDRDAPPRGRGLIWTLIWSAVGVGLLAGGYVLAAPYVEARIFRPQIETTEISLVSPAGNAVELTSTGYVVPEQRSKVGAKLTGRIARLLVREGDRIKAGQVIAELEDAEQKSALVVARARVLTLRARADLARARLAETRLQAERQHALVAHDAASKASADDLDARGRSLAESVRTAEAEIGSAEAELQRLSVDLSATTVRAPIDGTILAKDADVGEMVGPAGSPIVEIADLASLVIETDVPEARLGKVREGSPCEIVLDAYPSRRYRGAARQIVPKVNRAKATVPVKVRFVDPADGVLPDMAARVSFLDRPLDAEAIKLAPKLIVPKTAIAEREGKSVVFVLEGDQVRQVPIGLGPAWGSGFELVEGPPAGTRLVAWPTLLLRDGQKIKEKNP